MLFSSTLLIKCFLQKKRVLCTLFASIIKKSGVRKYLHTFPTKLSLKLLYDANCSKLNLGVIKINSMAAAYCIRGSNCWRVGKKPKVK